MSVLIEVAVTSPRDAAAAQAAGADRLELSCAMELGGLTPSPGLLEATLESTSLPVIALVRPRPGGFAYDEGEVDLMAREAAAMIRYGAAGVAFGCLTADHWVHNDRTARVAVAALHAAGGNCQTVFHRAFDMTVDPYASIDALAALGIQRVLTSGQCNRAVDGAVLIRRLLQHADGRIEIIAGSGINDRNITPLLTRSHCTQIHGSFSGEYLDDAGPVAETVYHRFDPQRFQRVRQRIQSHLEKTPA